jgi:AbrB family looped-hinge helix DNA binding protein
MANFGIVRRFDGLGRICVPSELRKSLNISNGDPCEIFIRDGLICLKKCEGKSTDEIVMDLIKNLSRDSDIRNNSDVIHKLKEVIALLESQPA